MKNGIGFSGRCLSLGALLVAAPLFSSCLLGGGSSRAPALPFPATDEEVRESMNEVSEAAETIREDVDSSIEKAVARESVVDLAGIAAKIMREPGISSAVPTPTGTAIVVRKSDGLFFNVLVADMSDSRLFGPSAGAPKIAPDDGVTFGRALGRRAAIASSLQGNKALILAPFSSQGLGDNIPAVEGLLEGMGFEVRTFVDAEAGLAKFRADYMQQFDVVYIETHGVTGVSALDGTMTTALLTGEKFGEGIAVPAAYSSLTEAQRNALAAVVQKKDGYLAITVPWLSLTSGSGFKNSFIFTSACESSKYDSGPASLSAALFDLGAGAHLGYDGVMNMILSRGMAKKVLTELSKGVDLRTASMRTREDPDIGPLEYVLRLLDGATANPDLLDDSQKSGADFLLVDSSEKVGVATMFPVSGVPGTAVTYEVVVSPLFADRVASIIFDIDNTGERIGMTKIGARTWRRGDMNAPEATYYPRLDTFTFSAFDEDLNLLGQGTATFTIRQPIGDFIKSGTPKSRRYAARLGDVAAGD